MNADNKKYYLYAYGQRIPVSEQVYHAYWHYTEKERYFMGKMKQEKFICDPENQIAAFFPGREDSYERLLETDQQFSADETSMEGTVTTSIWLQDLLSGLSEEEKFIIYQLYYLECSEREVSDALHLARTSFQRRKKKLLAKLKALIEKDL